MKTLVSTLSIFALTLAATSLDAYPLDGGTWLTAAMVAALFGLALNDSRRATADAARSL